MKLNNLVLLPLLVACGSKAPPQAPSSALPPAPVQDPPQEVIANPIPALAQTPDPAPPPPKMFAAQVDLVPVRGQKLKQVVVKFQQEEGKSAVATADAGLDSLKPGTYHLIVHEAAECGTNASKAGKIWEPVAATPITISATKDSPAKLDGTDISLAIEGDQTIVGRTLVLHDDAKGKPGKVLACGPVVKIDIGDSSATQAPPSK